ncbi:MAG: efflux RND transporter periplasmic adaptor subunit [Oleiphilaceae bacterium]|nr:efflux RND transporter periplasmic adaptor subunit [Oleiphilaceae bacterium]
MLSKLLPLTVFAALVALAYLITQTSPSAADGKSPQRPALQVDTFSLVPTEFVPTIRSSGTLQPYREIATFPLVSGQIIEVAEKVKAGASIAKGELLFRLDDAEYRVALVNAQAALEQAKAALAEEQARSDQAQSDWRKQGQQPSRFALREPQLHAAKANVERAQSELELARLNLARTQIKATANMRLVRVNAKLGAYVGPTSELATGYVTERAEIPLPVAGDDLRWLAWSNDPIPVMLFNPLTQTAEAWSAVVHRSEASVDERTQQLLLVAEVEHPFESSSNKTPLIMGQFMEAKMHGKPIADALVIDNAYIYQGPSVYVVEHGVLQRRDITLLRREGERSVIASGLSAGDQVVTTLLGNISSGTRVQVGASSETQP